MTVPNMDDGLEWRQLVRSLEILSFDATERDGFARCVARVRANFTCVLINFHPSVLAAVLLLGDLQFKSTADGNAAILDPSRLVGIAAALGIEEHALNRVLTSKTLTVR